MGATRPEYQFLVCNQRTCCSHVHILENLYNGFTWIFTHCDNVFVFVVVVVVVVVVDWLPKW